MDQREFKSLTWKFMQYMRKKHVCFLKTQLILHSKSFLMGYTTPSPNKFHLTSLGKSWYGYAWYVPTPGTPTQLTYS